VGRTARLRVRLYLRTRRLFDAGQRVAQAGFDGLWLGLLDRPDLDAVDVSYYERERQYVDPAYNDQGLWPWERRAAEQHFSACRRVAVLGAGAGREVVALHRMGFEVDGFECNHRLLSSGNRLLEALGVPPRIAPMPRDRWPDAAGQYDGVILGWGMYMLVPDRTARVALLGETRRRLPEGGPVLVSFFVRSGRERYFRTTRRLANTVRSMRRKDPVEHGATLAPNRVTFLTVAEVGDELLEAGFTIAGSGVDDYGHAVGLAAAGPGSATSLHQARSVPPARPRPVTVGGA
jgi:hypothetical protein